MDLYSSYIFIYSQLTRNKHFILFVRSQDLICSYYRQLYVHLTTMNKSFIPFSEFMSPLFLPYCHSHYKLFSVWIARHIFSGTFSFGRHIHENAQKTDFDKGKIYFWASECVVQ